MAVAQPGASDVVTTAPARLGAPPSTASHPAPATPGPATCYPACEGGGSGRQLVRRRGVPTERVGLPVHQRLASPARGARSRAVRRRRRGVAVGDASKGLCGGMIYAVRDLHEAHLPPPERASRRDRVAVVLVRRAALDRQLRRAARGRPYYPLIRRQTPIQTDRSVTGLARRERASSRSGRGSGWIWTQAGCRLSDSSRSRPRTLGGWP